MLELPHPSQLSFYWGSFFSKWTCNSLLLRILLCFFYFLLRQPVLHETLASPLVLNWLKEKQRSCTLCTLSPHCWALFVLFLSQVMKSSLLLPKRGQVQQLFHTCFQHKSAHNTSYNWRTVLFWQRKGWQWYLFWHNPFKTFNFHLLVLFFRQSSEGNFISEFHKLNRKALIWRHSCKLFL